MITDSQYEKSALLIGCDVPAVKAVAEVESKGSGFLSNGDVMILFEPHIFYGELKLKGITPTVSDICYEKWGTKPYGKYSEQWPKLNRAIQIDETAALKSASYGKFQILGKYYYECGCKDVQEFVAAMKKDESEHLRLFTNLIISRGLQQALKKLDWVAFAKAYNGAGYAKNQYDIKLAKAYQKYNT